MEICADLCSNPNIHEMKWKFVQILELWVFSITEYPPHPNFQLFSLSPNPKLQNTPPIQISNFFPEIQIQSYRIPPSKFPTFFPKSKSEVTEYPPNPNLQLFPEVQIRSYRIPPQKWKFRQILTLSFSVSE